MKYLSYLLICFCIFTVSCKKKSENPPLSLQGNWHTVQETWNNIYPRNNRFSTKNEISKEFFSFKALEISEKRIKIIYPDDDYAHPYYTIEHDSATKLNYIKIGNGSDVKFEYTIKENHLIIKTYSSGKTDDIGPNYFFNEIILNRD